MAASISRDHGASSSSSSSSSRYSYHVFLSFRGEDTRKNFTDHLYTALVKARLRTFRDNEEIERGEDIKLELRNAIHRSKTSVIVFSEDYASSGWCLDELAMIMERKRSAAGHAILPVFYGIDPSEVGKQTGSVAEAFAAHEEKFSGGTDARREEWRERVNGWREALRELADSGGMVWQNQANDYESKFIEKVVKVISDKVRRPILNIGPYLIGIHSRAEHINSWIQDGSNDVEIMSICGMGGIGKTTIAKFVFNLNFDQFPACSFLANVRETSKLPNGLVRLQRQLVSDVLKGRKEKIYNVDQGISMIKDAICCKKILLVLDDVDGVEQLDAVLGMRNWFYPGSKIIITTRHEFLLNPRAVHEVCKVEELNQEESIELLSWHAFGQAYPIKGYFEYSKRVVQQCVGLPLALQVLGSSLSGRTLGVWESALQKLEAIPENQILKKLKISFDSLQDDHDKNLFLHVSCFFVGMDRDCTVKILDQCDFFTIVGIQNLVDRTLITIDEYNKLVMHQLIRDMGREIVRWESPMVPGKRSRLWHHKDSFNVLRDKTGTMTVEGIILDMQMLMKYMSTRTSFRVSEVKKQGLEEFLDNSSNQSSSSGTRSGPRRMVELKTEAFAKMHKLKLVNLNQVRFSGDYMEFPKSLRWLRWHGFYLKSIPSNFPLDNLVVIDMRHSRLVKLWEGTKFLGLLKILKLSHSHELRKTPDFSRLPKLERLILKDCTSLIQVHESVGTLKRLTHLNLKDCKNLKKLPENIGKLKSLETLIISGCNKLKWLPTKLSQMGSLKVLEADGISLNQVMGCGFIPFFWLQKLRKNPGISTTSLPYSLVSLSLAGCNLSEDVFPMNFSNLSLLKQLNLSRNPIRSLPESVRGLSGLQRLELVSCAELKSLLMLPGIKELNVDECKSLEKISYQSTESKLKDMTCTECDNLVEIEGRFKLVPIENVDEDTTNTLGLLEFKSMRNTTLKLLHFYCDDEKEVPLQGLYQRGVFSTFVPGNSVPSWFSHRCTGHSISFTVPLVFDKKIKGLNLCSVYTLPEEVDRLSSWSVPCTTINNFTKNMQWDQYPSFLGMPEKNVGVLWLSHWKFGNLLESGDHVEVSVGTKHRLRVVEIGAHIVYYEEAEEEGGDGFRVDEIEGTNPFRNVVPGEVSGQERVYRIFEVL